MKRSEEEEDTLRCSIEKFKESHLFARVNEKSQIAR